MPSLPDHPTEVSAASVVIDAKMVEIVAFAIHWLGPASSRACWVGRPIEVEVADPTTAAALRAALEVTRRRRSTDGLIRIVCAAEQEAEAALSAA